MAAQLAALLQDDPHVDVRRTAALSLGKIATPGSATALIRALRDVDPLARQYSAWALGNLGDQAPEEAGSALVALLSDSSPAVAGAAAEAIGQIGASQRVLDLLIGAVRAPSVNTRRAAVKALAWLEAPSTYSAMVQALNDPDAEVRQGALAALGELGDRLAVPAIQDRLLHDFSAGVRTEAAYRLGKLGDGGAMPALQRVLESDPESKVRRWAAWAIEQLASSGEPESKT
ncbi:MAG: HEAT repeat domain-containing protein [Nitrospiraceae bacterium]